MHLCANISMLFTEAPMPARIALAADAGFDSVEIQFPPPDDETALIHARDRAGIPITLINVPLGAEGEVGLPALPGRESEFAEALAFTVRQAQVLGVAKVNLLAGRPPAGTERAACAEYLTANLRRAADAFAAIGVRAMVEAVNPRDVPGFFLASLEQGLEALARADHPNLALQFDFYHMAITEPDLPAAIRAAGARIGHVQFADAPGRHEPGTGRIDFAAAFAALRATGYAGAVSAEYRPAGETRAGLGWIPRIREMIA